jgi:hypothetical protein
MASIFGRSLWWLAPRYLACCLNANRMMIFSQQFATIGAKARRLPNGWKRHTDSMYCKACWAAKYVLRSITIPVHGATDCDWPTLREKLKAGWVLSTAAANFLTTEYYAADVRRDPSMKTLPAVPQTYLYPQLRKRFPELPSCACARLINTIRAKYMKARLGVIWLCDASLPNYRYPHAFLVSPDDWTPSFDELSGPTVSVPLPGQRVTLRLRRGFQFRRQLVAFEKIVNGEAIPSEIALYRVSARESDGRNGCKDGSRTTTRIMCRIAAWLPRDPMADATQGTMFVRTDSDSLLIALNTKKERLWIKHADRVRDWQFQHRRWLQRVADDSKFERRYPRRRRMRTLVDYRLRGTKYRSRLDTFIDQIAAEVIGYAVRRKFAVVQYDDSDKRYSTTFPWYQLHTTIAEKADAAGLQFRHISSEEKG